MSIQNELDKIKYAVKGEEVRRAIHDGIKQAYDDASIEKDNANMEVKMARGNEKTLGQRLDGILNLPSTVYVSEEEPQSVSEGSVWFKITDTVYINPPPSVDYLFRFDASTLDLVNGGEVNSWADSSGNKSTLNAVDKKPTFNDKGFNGKPTVSFDNSPMDANLSIDVTNSYTLFIVAKFDDLSASTTLLGIGEEAGSSAKARKFLMRLSSSAKKLQPYLNATVLESVVISGSPMLYSSIYSGTNVKSYLNGIGEINAPYSQPIDFGLGTKLRIGDALLIGSSEPFKGKISEVIYFNRSLSAEDVNQMNIYLMDKWGL